MSKLEGKIALITGGNGGIGLATAKQFVSEGAYVGVSRIRRQQLHHGNGIVCRRRPGASVGG